jgi:hypothetical protein
VVTRLFGLVAMLLAIAMLAIGVTGMARGAPRPPSAGYGFASTDGFEPASDTASHEAPTPAPEPGDDDDDDDQELAIEPSVVVALRSADSACPPAQNETIRPSLGHPRGIDDPPRS